MNKYKIYVFDTSRYPTTDILMVEASDMLLALQQSGVMPNTIIKIESQMFIQEDKQDEG